MAVEITMSKLGMTMEEGKLLEWAKKEKDTVRKGEVLLVIESDKVTYEVESPGSGLLAILVEKGEGIPVGTLLGLLAESEEEYNLIREKASAAAGVSATAPSPGGASAGAQAPEGPPPVSEPKGPVRATPGARELARQKGIDLAAVAGSGPQGRITREDVLRALENPPPAVPADSPAAETPVSKGSGRKRLLKEEPMSGMRAAISRRMLQSLQTSAQMTAFSEWDLTELMNLRALINRSEERNGYRATIPGLMVALLARVLKEMPIFNASVEGDRIRHWLDVNIGVAVAVPEGLVVPVIHGADGKSLFEIHKTLVDLIDRARQKKLLPDDMSDGTFTLTNLGSYGGEWETIIVNPPEVAILGIGRIAPKPVVREDRIEIRQMMPVSLTVDHRIIDGETSGRFRRRMKELAENPGLVWTEGSF